jgi:hypothetical protein
MSDEKKEAAPSGSVGAGPSKVITEIAFCPHLGIYHYRTVDGTEYLFDSSRLEMAVDGYLRNSDAKQAEFMVLLTGFARQFPHQVVSFDEEGTINLRELLVQQLPAESDGDVPSEEIARGQLLPFKKGGEEDGGEGGA